MNRREFQIGPGAASLLLIAVVLCMGVLGTLTLVSAQNDAKLSERTLMMAEAAASLNVSAEVKLAEIDAILIEAASAADEEAYLDAIRAALPEGMELEGRTIRWMEASEEGRRLDCGVEITYLGDSPRYIWVDHMLWTELDENTDTTEYEFYVP